ncbi:LysM peptidoglycan-binding domain-containing protein [Spirosoma gilvum]
MKTISFCSALLVLGGFSYLHLPSAQANTTALSHTLVIDSLRIEKKDGKRFIVHRVDEGQTLFAISRKYKRSVADIKAANPDMKDAVRYDQLILIPIADGALSRKEEKAINKAIRKQEKEAKREAREQEKEAQKTEDVKPVAKAEKALEKEAKKADDPASGIHVVETGQTLYSLANRYGVSQADIRKWNNLSGNNVLIGQALIVSEKAYLARTPSNSVATTTKTTSAPSRPAQSHPVDSNTNEPRAHETRPTPRTEPKSPPKSEEDLPAHPSGTSPSKPSEPEPEPPRPGNDAPMPTQGRRLSASGVAEMIEGTDGSGKYLALHRTAPIGTLVQVRNEFNNQSLWVKVIGRLPNTGINDKILIKLSSQAFAKLSPEDRRFRAEVSYIVR